MLLLMLPLDVAVAVAKVTGCWLQPGHGAPIGGTHCCLL